VSVPHILIVEDDDALRGEMVELLKALGAMVVGVAGGADAISASTLQTFDLVLCDYKLESENGLDVLRELSSLGLGPGIEHRYLMTGHVDLTRSGQRDIAEMTAGLLHKPIGTAVLRDLVARAARARPC
jgi:CheY-like chemotaxis protein